jgi:hypothetical protein
MINESVIEEVAAGPAGAKKILDGSKISRDEHKEFDMRLEMTAVENQGFSSEDSLILKKYTKQQVHTLNL